MMDEFREVFQLALPATTEPRPSTGSGEQDKV